MQFCSHATLHKFENYAPKDNSTQANQLSLYGDLWWSRFFVTRSHAEDFPFVAASSPPSTAVSYAQRKQSSRRPSRFSRRDSPPSITSRYPASRVAFFDLHSFEWACVLPPSALSTHISCSVGIRGYSGSGVVTPQSMNERNVAIFKYTPDVKKRQRPVMQRVLVPWTKFNGLHTLTFELLPAGARLFLNNLSVLTYNVTDWDDGLNALIHEEGRNGWGL